MPLDIPLVIAAPGAGGLGLAGLLSLTAGFQLLGGILGFIFLSRLRRHQKHMWLLATVLMFLVVFYSFTFLAKTWTTLLLFFLGLGGFFAAHAALMRKRSMRPAFAIFAMMAFHEFIEGLFVGGAFLYDVRIGVASGLLIALHEIPEGMISGIPFFLRGRAREGFISIALSVLVYIAAGVGLQMLGLSKALLRQVDAVLIGGVVALGIMELSAIRKS